MSEYVVLEQEMKDMADTVTKYIPRISDALEEIAISLNYLRRLENNAVSKEDLRERIERTWNKDWYK